MSVSDYTPKRTSSVDRKSYQVPKKSKTHMTKFTKFIESIEIMSKDHDSSEPPTPDRDGIIRNAPSTSSVRVLKVPKDDKITSKSLASSPYKVEMKKSPILRCLEFPKISLSEKTKEKSSPTNILEENFLKFMSTFPKRRSSTPSSFKQKRIGELRESGVKTDSENDDVFLNRQRKKLFKGSEIICDTPENLIIKTAPSAERVRELSTTSSDDEVCRFVLKIFFLNSFFFLQKMDKNELN